MGKLAEKGEALSWADFEPSDHIETGFGLCIRVYSIAEIFSASISSGGPDVLKIERTDVRPSASPDRWRFGFASNSYKTLKPLRFQGFSV